MSTDIRDGTDDSTRMSMVTRIFLRVSVRSIDPGVGGGHQNMFAYAFECKNIDALQPA